MAEYRLTREPSEARQHRRAFWLRFFVVAVAAAIVIPFARIADRSTFETVAAVGALFSGSIVLSYRSLLRHRSETRLTVTPQEIVLRMHGQPEFRLERAEMTGFTERERVLSITSGSRFKFIPVPAELENPAGLRDELVRMGLQPQPPRSRFTPFLLTLGLSAPVAFWVDALRTNAGPGLLLFGLASLLAWLALIVYIRRKNSRMRVPWDVAAVLLMDPGLRAVNRHIPKPWPGYVRPVEAAVMVGAVALLVWGISQRRKPRQGPEASPAAS